MKKLLLILTLIFGVLAGNTAYSADLSAVAKRPLGQLNDYLSDNTISVTFNKPVAALGEASQLSSANCPLVISPAVKGECRWLGSQTVTFTPEDAFKLATKYTVTVKAGLKSQVGGEKLKNNIVWSFSTARPSVMNTKPNNNEHWINLAPKIMVSFNMPVNMYQVKKFISFTEGTENTPFTVSKISDSLFEKEFKYSSIKKDNIIVIEPSSALKQDRHYKVTLKTGLPPAAGSLTMLKDKTLNFYTYNYFDLARNPQSECLPYTPALQFTNPVSAGEVFKNISFVPELKYKPCDETSIGWEDTLDGDDPQRVYKVPLCGIEFKPGEKYAVKLSKDLTDIFGNKLGHEVTFDWDNKGYCPALTFKGGFGVLESYLKPYHPVQAVNAGEILVEKQKISLKNFIPFYQEEVNWCAKRELKGDFLSKVFNPNMERNVSANTFIDLAPVLGDAKSGFIFTQLLNPSDDKRSCWQSAVDNVTDLGITLKSSPESILVWATYLKDGSAAKNKEVELRDYKNNVLWTGKTNSKGIASAPGWAKLNFEREDDWRTPQIWAFVKGVDDIAVISSYWNDGIQPWRFNINYDWNAKPVQNKAFTFTERGIYRPGEKVYIKSILRTLKEGRFTNAGIKKVKLSITDPRGQSALSKEVDVDAKTSSFSYTYTVNSAAPTGYWNVEVTADGLSSSTDFRVEDVKPAEFKVDLVPLADNYFAGEKAAFALSAKYMFGAVLADADVRWNIQLMPAYFTPKGYDGYNFGGGRDNKAETILSSSAKLDASGSADISVALPKIDYTAMVYAQAGVLSPQNQELFARKSSYVFPSDLYIGVKTDESMVEAGTPFTAKIVTVNPEGLKTDIVNLKGQVIRKEYMSVKKSGVSGRLEWVSDEKTEVLQNFTVTTQNGEATWSFTPTRPGSYYMQLSGTDRAGRENETSFSFYVSAEGEAYWKQADDDILQLEADKSEYKVGGKAKILVKSPFKTARALITVERDGILDSRVETIKSGARYITIPVKDNYDPNVFVSIVLVQGRSKDAKFSEDGNDLGKPQAKFGYVTLNVSSGLHKIKTNIEADKKDYRPGETVTVTVNTLNQKGKGMASDITVFAVDESVLSLTGYTTPDIFSYFYSKRPLSVDTADTRLFIIGQRSFGQKGENRGGGGADSKLGGIDLRSNFEFTPFYTGSVATDLSGNAVVSFKLPDNLSKFRIMAVAASADNFGSGETSIEVSKPVMLKPMLPRFARLGDKFDCGFIVYNYTKEENLSVDLDSLISGSIKVLAPLQKNVVIPAGKSVTVLGKCEAQNIGESTFKFTASSSKGNDGLELKVPVLAVEHQQTLALSASTDWIAQETVIRPTSIIAGQNNVLDITLASTALLDIKGALTYLSNYPFNCLEQRMSKLLPIISAEDLFKAFDLGDVEKLKAEAKKLLAEVVTYQAPAGGLGYWPYPTQPDPYVTAYALDVMNIAKKNGYEVDQQLFDGAAAWLNQYLTVKQKWAYDYNANENDIAKAYAVYALTLTNENAGGYFSNMYADRAEMPLEAKVYLLKAAKNLKLNTAYSALLTEIMNYAKDSNTTMHFEAPGNMSWIYSSDVKATALVMQAVLSTAGKFPGDSKAVTWLLRQLNKQGNWGNTITNATAFRALNEYFKLNEEQEPDFKAVIKADTKAIFETAFKGRSIKTESANIPFKDIFTASDTALIDMEKTGTGLMYYNLALKYYPAKLDNNVDAGFKVSREVKPLYEKLGPLATGHRALVTVTVTSPQARTFVVLEDYLPAGFDIVDTSLATEGNFDAQAADEISENTYYFSRTEKYQDKIAAFADYLPKGTHKFSYIVSASTAGTFAQPTTWVSQMYEPEVFGRTAGSELTIK